MVVEKRINNNVILAKDSEQQVILIGNGIGFKVYPGDPVNESKIEKTFYSGGSLSLEQMAGLVTNASAKEIDLLDQIVSMGQKEIAQPLKPNIFFTLLDHVLFAIKRQSNQMAIISPLEWEIKKFYPKEYSAGLKAVSLINWQLGVELPVSEAAFIALHFVNGQLETEMSSDAIELTEMTNRIVKLVKYQMKCDINEESVFFHRFLTHIRYYLMRQRKGEHLQNHANQHLSQSVQRRYPEETFCADQIADYIYATKGWQTTETEKMYLILHICNLIEKAK